jgi:predicted rRNA methylase YqxC with S4 and FtsJ domains
MPPPYNPLAEIVSATIKLPFEIGRSLLRAGGVVGGKGKARRAEKRARREAEAQRKEWRELVERQKTRGEAGNTSYEEAAEALRGAGGRPNPLDQRKF